MNGCRYCGIAAWEHARQWAPEVKWHTFVEPTDGQRKARLLARRAAEAGVQ